MNIDLSKYPLFSDHEKESLTILSNQGLSNKNYTFQNHNTTYLLRKFILQDRDRELEYKIQSLAYEQGIAAKPFLLDIEYGLMICEFLEGEHKQILSRKALKKIVEVLKKLHAIKIESEILDLESLFTIQGKGVKEAFATLEKYPKEVFLCHNDLNPKNILFSNHSVKFIDWEFSANNDLYFDLALVRKSVIVRTKFILIPLQCHVNTFATTHIVSVNMVADDFVSFGSAFGLGRIK